MRKMITAGIVALPLFGGLVPQCASLGDVDVTGTDAHIRYHPDPERVVGSVVIHTNHKPKQFSGTMIMQWRNKTAKKWEFAGRKHMGLADLPAAGKSKTVRIVYPACLITKWRLRFSWEGISHTGKEQTGVHFYPDKYGVALDCNNS
jgi:hypothetical protein